MKRTILLLTLVGVLIAGDAIAQPTRIYTPVVKHVAYTTAQTDEEIWIPGSDYDCIVWDGFIISTDQEQEITISASDTIVRVQVSASRPVVSPAGFLWKGIKDEVIRATTQFGEVFISLFGWEEN